MQLSPNGTNGNKCFSISEKRGVVKLPSIPSREDVGQHPFVLHRGNGMKKPRKPHVFRGFVRGNYFAHIRNSSYASPPPRTERGMSRSDRGSGWAAGVGCCLFHSGYMLCSGRDTPHDAIFRLRRNGSRRTR